MATSMLNDTPMIIEEIIVRKCTNGEPVNILVTGKTGAGKSSLINGLIGGSERVAEEGIDLGGTTREVATYSKVVNGVKFNIWDAPGVQDITEGDDEIFEQIKTQLKQECTNIHLMVYCLRMDTDRVQSSDELAIKRVTECFSHKIWETSVIALTYANRVETPPHIDEIEDEESRREKEKHYFNQRPIDYKKMIINILINIRMNKRKASEIAVIPTGYHKPTRARPNPYKVLDIEDWYNPFWMACAERMKETALASLIVSQMDRIVVVSENYNPEQQQPRNTGDQELPSNRRNIHVGSSSWERFKSFWKSLFKTQPRDQQYTCIIVEQTEDTNL